jgi:hypothetical protein
MDKLNKNNTRIIHFRFYSDTIINSSKQAYDDKAINQTKDEQLNYLGHSIDTTLWIIEHITKISPGFKNEASLTTSDLTRRRT